MDLSPQTLRDVEFREKLRGYHPDDVDDFLEDAALALEGLLSRLQTAETIASAVGDATPVVAEPAPAQPTEDVAPAADVTEHTLRRTLLLAQRTADAAVADAEESARKVVETAKSEANRIMAEAEARAATTTREVRARTESAVADLEQRKIGLEREVAALQAWATQQRDRLRDVLSDQMRALDIWLATSGTPRPLGGRPSVPSRSDSDAVDEPIDEPGHDTVTLPPDSDAPDSDAIVGGADVAAEPDRGDDRPEPEDGEQPADEGDGEARLEGRVFRRQ